MQVVSPAGSRLEHALRSKVSAAPVLLITTCEYAIDDPLRTIPELSGVTITSPNVPSRTVISSSASSEKGRP